MEHPRSYQSVHQVQRQIRVSQTGKCWDMALKFRVTTSSQEKYHRG
jgi:hypothetical protein